MVFRHHSAWAARLALLAFVLLTAAVRGAAQPPPYGLEITDEWYRSVFGENLGIGGIQIADLDGSGETKILTTARAAGQSYWYVLSFVDGEYRQEWVSDLFPGGIGALRAVDLDGVPGAEVVVSEGSDIHVFHGATPRLVRTIETGTPEPVHDLQVADADGDGDLDFVFCSYPGLYVLDATTGDEVFRRDDLRCDGVAVGNVDNDRSPEIVLGRRPDLTPRPGYVLDGATRELQWTLAGGFGNLVRTGDLDGDGRDEIVAGAAFAPQLTVYDAEQRAAAWEIPIGDYHLGAVRILDVEGDGPPEIVFGDRDEGEVHVWDPRARKPLWSADPDFADQLVNELAVGDPDGDGTNELVWGVGGSGFQVVSTATHESEWQPEGAAGPFRGLDFGDVDADGAPEILYASALRGIFSHGSTVFIHDARTKALERELATAWDDLRQIRHADVDGDPQAEIFLRVRTNDDLVVSYDGLTLEEEWRWSTGGRIDNLEVADLEGDGDPEVIVTKGTRVIALDAATGQETWRTDPIGSGTDSLLDLHVANVDADPGLEIILIRSFGRALVVFDATTHAVERQIFGLDAYTLATADRDGDGVDEILIGTSIGRVEVIDPATGEVAATLGDYGDTIYGLATADLTGDGIPDLVLSHEREILVADGFYPDEVLWRSGVIGFGVGFRDGLQVADVDGDGKTEILVSLGRPGVRLYQVEGVADAPPVPAGPYLETPELPGFRFKVRITAGDQELAGSQETDCLGETLCVSGALAGRSELFLRVIGPRPNGFLWVNLVRFTPSHVEVWAERIASGEVNYYELPALPPQDTQLAGLVDKRAFPADLGAAWTSPRRRLPGSPGVASVEPGWRAGAPSAGTRPATFTSEAFPGFAISVRIVAGGDEQPVRAEADCLAETVCVSGAVPGRSELFVRLIGPRPNGYLWLNLVRFTPSRVEVTIEQLASGERRTYVLEQIPSDSDQLPGRLDRQAFSP